MVMVSICWLKREWINKIMISWYLIRLSVIRIILRFTGIKRLLVIWKYMNNIWLKVEKKLIRLILRIIKNSQSFFIPQKIPFYFLWKILQQIHLSSRISSYKNQLSKPRHKLSPKLVIKFKANLLGFQFQKRTKLNQKNHSVAHWW